MGSRAKFLEAKWQNLCLLTYAVEPKFLSKYMPPGLTADTIDGAAFISLVAFDFQDTKVLGVKWPGFINFPEINLRFYVKHGDERGVVFIRELVPQFFVAMMAKLLYNEPYLSCPMKSSVKSKHDLIEIHHQIQFNKIPYELKLTARNEPFLPGEQSQEHFFKEHRWGFGTSSDGKLIRYEVEHEHWVVYPVVSHHIDFDFAAIYGPDFSFLQNAEPISIILAKGSEIAVYPKG